MLQGKYQEYSRKKYNSFKEQVAKGEVFDDHTHFSSTHYTSVYRSITDELEPAERNHLIKKRVESEGEGSICDDHENEVLTDSDVELAHVVSMSELYE